MESHDRERVLELLAKTPFLQAFNVFTEDELLSMVKQHSQDTWEKSREKMGILAEYLEELELRELYDMAQKYSGIEEKKVLKEK